MNKPTLQPEQIFGLVDETLDRMERNGRKKRPRQPTALPKMKVKRSKQLDEFDKVDAGNVVYVPDSTLKQVAAALNVETKALNDAFLQKIVPMLLSYQTSTNYSKAALKEGLGVEIDFDVGLEECVKHVGYLNVVMHFVRRSRIPSSVKKRFMNHFSDKLAEQALAALIAANKDEQRKILQDQLQAVVYSRQKNKTEVKTRESEQDKPERQNKLKQQHNDGPERKPTGVKRSRRS